MYQDCLNPPHGGIVIVKQHGERNWNVGRVVIQQDFVVSLFEPPLFTLRQLGSIRLIFVRNLGIVRGVSNGGRYYQV